MRGKPGFERLAGIGYLAQEMRAARPWTLQFVCLLPNYADPSLYLSHACTTKSCVAEAYDTTIPVSADV
jgi:hypothetical protein